jgi:hypothetical protein
MSRTPSEAPKRAVTSRRDWVESLALNGLTVTPFFASSLGYARSSAAPMPRISERACSSETPGRRRPTTLSQLFVRSSYICSSKRAGIQKRVSRRG